MNLRTRKPALVPSNFDFLATTHPLLATCGRRAEQNLREGDANTCLLKVRQVVELLVREMSRGEDEAELDFGTPFGLLLRDIGAYRGRKFTQPLFDLYGLGSEAMHELLDDPNEARVALERAWEWCAWFLRAYVDETFAAPAFVQPEDLRVVRVGRPRRVSKVATTTTKKASAKRKGVSRSKTPSGKRKASARARKGQGDRNLA